MEEQACIAHAGVDIGSATVKLVVLDNAHTVIFARYERHYSQVRATLARIMAEGHAALPHVLWNITLTGSGAIDVSSALDLPFVQEVVACTECIRQRLPQCDVSIELGGEDAKITFFTGGVEQRMNETCAGGTGAFIDHMANMLHTDPMGLDALARNHTNLYPIASRCGVFAKTDILPLLNEGCAKEDIAASIFQAVVEQCIGGLACGRDISGTVVFLGGPLAFLGALRQRFVDALGLEEAQAIFPPYAEYFVAMGAAYVSMACAKTQAYPYSSLQQGLHALEQQASSLEHCLPPLFADAQARAAFTARHARASTPRARLEEHAGPVFLGLDMGSTTTKAVCIDPEGTLLYTFYGPNKGEPLQAAIHILRDVYARMHPQAHMAAAAVTGYGSTLVRAALGVDIDEVETVAHWTAARFFLPQVSYILDIGGQDIKCLRLRDGIIDTIQLNEACSSGCGSFVESFANSLNMNLVEFVEQALSGEHPIDLGTRCTVFMNSRVKQAQKEGASVGDIAAGLSYSVIRNALYKVIKIKDIEELGAHVIAQGGAFHNDALLRALELCLGRSVLRPDIAGLMGAFGAALLARDRAPALSHDHKTPFGISNLCSAQALDNFTVHNTVTRCQACPNHCQLTVSRFPDGTRFISGNRCERGAGLHCEQSALPNVVSWKYQRLFEHYSPLPEHRAPRGLLFMPRTLGMFEHYPLWFTLFTHLGFRVELSPPSSRSLYALGCHTIPSQTLCYPAKLAHGHMVALAKEHRGAVFFPCVPLEQRQFAQQDHHYNCPVVGGYPELIAQNIDALRLKDAVYFRPFLPMDRTKLAARLAQLPLLAGITKSQLQ
ncbi:MAG: BadF/BadG/BcrA/BcrD ATPase family protein, partial [Desulfovibrionaceae bacterium]